MRIAEAAKFFLEALEIQVRDSCQPIANPPSKLSDSFNPPNSDCQLGAQPSVLSRLIGQSSDRRKMKIYRGGGKCKALMERAISNHDTPVKPNARLGAIPIDEFFDGTSVGPAGMCRRPGGEHADLGLLKFRDCEAC